MFIVQFRHLCFEMLIFWIICKTKNHIHWTYFVFIFQEVAGANDDHKFGLAAAGSDIATENKVEGDAIVLFKKFDEGRNDMTEDLVNVEAIGKFVAANALPLVVEFNHETAQKIFSGEIKSHLLMFVSKKSDEFKAQHETAQTIAKEYKGQLLFVTIGMFLVSFKDFFWKLKKKPYFLILLSDMDGKRSLLISECSVLLSSQRVFTSVLLSRKFHVLMKIDIIWK